MNNLSKQDLKYYKKYIKYKNKYILAKQQFGSASKPKVVVESPPKGESDDEWVDVAVAEDRHIITEICCTTQGNTQYPSRMKHCESIKHTTGAFLADGAQGVVKPISKALAGLPNMSGSKSLGNLASYAQGKADSLVEMTDNKSLDGIVKIENETKGEIHIINDRPSIINKLNYISDHDGILNEITLNYGGNFNLITFNLEGLCRTGLEANIALSGTEFTRRLELLELHLYKYNIPGNIIVCQELVLQQYKDIEEQHVFINETQEFILQKMREIFNSNNIQGTNDNYTSGIFYDYNTWNITNQIEIGRHGSNKKSNAYLFTKINQVPNFSFWVVNIHLKADGTEDQHVSELKNIIQKVHEQNPDFEIPVYLCGDYNNQYPKKGLVEMAYRNLFSE